VVWVGEEEDKINVLVTVIHNDASLHKEHGENVLVVWQVDERGENRVRIRVIHNEATLYTDSDISVDLTDD
jgi:hypothetical protein